MTNDRRPIAENRKARHDYTLEQTIEAGIKLEGWEVKALRAGKAQLVDSYVVFKGGEVLLLGLQIQPLTTASSHVEADPQRTRVLLLGKNEIEKLRSQVEQKGYTCVALDLHWHKHLVKCTVALGRGKKLHDKRASEKSRDADREMQSAAKATHGQIG